MKKVDRFGRKWRLRKEETCKTCGQPDNVGECNHIRLSDDEVKQLGGQP